MTALTGVALWITLATVFPGLVTIAVIYGAFAIVAPDMMQGNPDIIAFDSEWMWVAIAVTIMILTQACGILLEELLVTKRWLGPEERKIKIFDQTVAGNLKEITLNPYIEYQGLYFLLVQLKESDDAQGHLGRIAAQFFLTNNTLVSYVIGIVATLVLAFTREPIFPLPAVFYLCGLAVCLVLSYFVAVIRFRVMAKSLRSIREIKKQNGSDASKPEEINVRIL
ncbi:MAG: hypothetical protein A2Z15_01165 [Chloroflexi bacterium RBG_16_50_11]|nr:MAG: hypothetical protein A2Z15_01165 [Chloroflexi bacterium RBG_16_50_11]